MDVNDAEHSDNGPLSTPRATPTLELSANLHILNRHTLDTRLRGAHAKYPITVGSQKFGLNDLQ